MQYGYNNQYPQYKPYAQPQQIWQPQQPQQAWQQPVWQPPAQEPVMQEPAPEPREDPVVTALRELTAEIAALRKAVTPRAVKKKEVDDE